MIQPVKVIHFHKPALLRLPLDTFTAFIFTILCYFCTIHPDTALSWDKNIVYVCIQIISVFSDTHGSWLQFFCILFNTTMASLSSVVRCFFTVWNKFQNKMLLFFLSCSWPMYSISWLTFSETVYKCQSFWLKNPNNEHTFLLMVHFMQSSSSHRQMNVDLSNHSGYDP